MKVQGPTTDHHEIRSWAERHRAVPVELLPQELDHEPPELRLMLPQMAATMKAVKVLMWDDFFARFDLLGLTFVYDTEATGYNELLQIDAKNPYRQKAYRAVPAEN